MKRQIFALAAGALIIGVTDADAQTADLSSLVDHDRAAVLVGPGTDQSPGTVGAMNAVAGGVATSAEDVRRQQEGRSTASDGGRSVSGAHAAAVIGQAPGTVGAMPGN